MYCDPEIGSLERIKSIDPVKKAIFIFQINPIAPDPAMITIKEIMEKIRDTF